MKHVTGLLFFVLVALLVGAMLGACSSPNKELADSLNRRHITSDIAILTRLSCMRVGQGWYRLENMMSDEPRL